MHRPLLALIALVSSSTALGGVDVGWIEKINGNPSDVQILRGGKKVEATQFLPIQKGDQLSVVNDNTSLEVSLANGKRLKVDKSKSQIAQQAGEVPALSGNLMNWVASLAKKESKEPRIITAASRNSNEGGKLSIPLLKDDTTLIAGDRTLALAWQGGKAPYEVKLVRRDTQMVGAVFQGVENNRIMEKINLAPGAYELVVSDSAGTTWREKVIAVSNRSLPEIPVEFQSMSSSLKQVLTASWLASIEDGKWDLEAYTLIATLPQHSLAEKMVLQALENGNAPDIK